MRSLRLLHYDSPPIGEVLCKPLIGEVAERSKALDWNSSNIFTGVRGFESHPLRHLTLSAKDHGGPHRFLRDDQS